MRVAALALLLSCSGASREPIGRHSSSGGARDVLPDPEPAPLGRLPGDVRPRRYELALTIVPSLDRFGGEVTIEVELDRARSVVWMHGQELAISEATVEPDGAEPIPARWEPVPDSEGVAALRTERPVPAGRAAIHLTWDAAFDRQLQGLYRVDSGGDSYAFTQFEAISARRAFPSFDEPAFKTPFDVSLTIPMGQVAISNTREREKTPASEGLERWTFATTEPLPTYLVAFAVGPLDVVDSQPIPPNAVRTTPLPFRAVAVKGRGSRLGYAVAETGKMVASLEDYFGIPYPYPKLDILAVPDFASGAMENAGAITFREPLLLIDEASAPEEQRRAFASVMAHELAHHWFGNLVTMPWWDDIWLNEAFATWMGHRIVERVYPQYQAGLALLERVQGAMGSDSLVSARRIRQPIESHHDIRNAFDSITYSKGAGVLAMFERWVGAETFRQGLHQYLEAHRFGSATADDLLAAISQAAGKDVATPFRTFLEQEGVPLVEATLACDAGRGSLRLAQSRFLPIGSTGERSRTWRVPVCARWQSGRDTKEGCTLLESAEGALAFDGGCADWVIPNAEGAGYYRWSLPSADVARVRRAWPRLSARERLSFADALGAAYGAAKLPAADVFAALEPLARDENRPVATTPAGFLRFARDYLVDDAARPRVEAFVRKLYGPAKARLGWEPRAREDGETKILRGDVLETLALVGRDPAVRREAAARGRRLLGVGSDAVDLDAAAPELVDLVLQVAIQDGDGAIWETALARFAASDDALLRNRLLGALGSTFDPALAERARALAFDPRVRVNEAMSTVQAGLGQRETREATWAWVQAHFDELVARLSRRGSGWLPWTAAAFCDEAHATAAQTFFQPKVADLPGAPRNLAGAVEVVRLCAARVEAHRESTATFFR